MTHAKQLTNSTFGAKAVDFLNIAYKDYLGARVLLNAGLLPQGAVLASTAVEKYFKAILAFRGNESRGHLSKKHINSVVNYDNRLSVVLSEPFLLLLQRAYDIRYTDNLQKGFNIVIAYREFLAELDHTALTIQQSFKMQLNGKGAIFSFDTDRERHSPNLFLNNYIILDLDKQAFISSAPQDVYELRNCPHRGLLEATYLSKARSSDGLFLREGFKPVDALGMEYQFSLAPIEAAGDAA
jgi:hypothetical protein